MWLISVDTLSIALSITFALALLTLAVPFTLCAEVIAEHSSEDKILFGRELMERTCDKETDSLQTLTSPKVHIHVLSFGRLQNVRNALTLQS